MSSRTPFEPNYFMTLHNQFYIMLAFIELIVIIFYFFRVSKPLLIRLWPMQHFSYLHTFYSRAGFIRCYQRWNTTQWDTLWKGNSVANLVYITWFLCYQFACLFCLPYMGSFPVALFPSHNVQWTSCSSKLLSMFSGSRICSCGWWTNISYHRRPIKTLPRRYHDSATTHEAL